MNRRFPAKGRLGSLAAALVVAALALTLSACGGAEPGNSATAGRNAAAVNGAVPGSSAAPGNTSALGGSGTSGGSGASGGGASGSTSVTDFCETWLLTATYFNQDVSILASRTSSYDYSTWASLLEPTINGINADLTTADQETPAAVSADMATLSSYWSNINADFQAQVDANDQVTVGQVMASMLSSPPGQSLTIEAALQDLSDYLATTCNVSIET